MSHALGGVHRPWPPPREPWLMAQTWHDLLFAHWPLPLETLRPLVPAALPLDTYGGQAWVSVVPFWMSGVRPRLPPSIPGISAFPELNLRTYVTLDNKPGVFFFSLDAGNPLAVRVARLLHLPYFDARMSVQWCRRYSISQPPHWRRPVARALLRPLSSDRAGAGSGGWLIGGLADGALLPLHGGPPWPRRPPRD